MPLEVRELVVKVDVGSPPPAPARSLDRQDLLRLKREIVEACLAELRHHTLPAEER